MAKPNESVVAGHSAAGPPLDPVVGAVLRALREYANESELYVAAAGREAVMHRTDLSGLAIVMDRGDRGEITTPGILSSRLHLSAPATSAMLDRLERLGHVNRLPHPTDRRSVVVEMTDHARSVGAAMFGRLGNRVGPVLAHYDRAELETVTRFLDDVIEATRDARADVIASGGTGTTP